MIVISAMGRCDECNAGFATELKVSYLYPLERLHIKPPKGWSSYQGQQICPLCLKDEDEKERI